MKKTKNQYEQNRLDLTNLPIKSNNKHKSYGCNRLSTIVHYEAGYKYAGIKSKTEYYYRGKEHCFFEQWNW